MSAFVLLSYSVNLPPALAFAPAVHVDTIGVWVQPDGEDITYKSVIEAIKQQHFDTLKADRADMSEERYMAKECIFRTMRKILSSLPRKVMPNQGPVQLVEAPSDVRLYNIVHTIMVSVQWYED